MQQGTLGNTMAEYCMVMEARAGSEQLAQNGTGWDRVQGTGGVPWKFPEHANSPPAVSHQSTCIVRSVLLRPAPCTHTDTHHLLCLRSALALI